MAVPQNNPPPPTRILSWQQSVQEADPNWLKNLIRPVIYIFSDGREFHIDPNWPTD